MIRVAQKKEADGGHRYLKRVMFKFEMLGMKNFVAYDPFGSAASETLQHLVLDGQTLSNLEVGWLVGSSVCWSVYSCLTADSGDARRHASWELAGVH